MGAVRRRLDAVVAEVRSRGRLAGAAGAVGGATLVMAAVALMSASFTAPAGTGAGEALSAAVVGEAESTLSVATVVEVRERATGLGPEWDLPNMDHPRVDYWIRQFQTNERMNERYQGFLDRGGAWVPMMKDRLEERNMPLDLIYLSMVESGFRPDAVSSAGAVGLWQFLRATGQEYGLAVDRAVDERRDPVKATEAGLDYLQRLHNRFGSWYLAMAAYNGGQNRVARVMRQTLGREKARSDQDYYRILSRLPKETQDYVPLIIAAARIAKDPEAYGFRPMQPSAAAWEEATFPPATQLREIARLYGTTLDDIQALNPHLLLLRTPNNREYTLRLPVGSTARYAAAGGAAVRGATAGAAGAAPGSVEGQLGE
jgi:membrane-bound lytic murein transglycosylase D